MVRSAWELGAGEAGRGFVVGYTVACACGAEFRVSMGGPWLVGRSDTRVVWKAPGGQRLFWRVGAAECSPAMKPVLGGGGPIRSMGARREGIPRSGLSVHAAPWELASANLHVPELLRMTYSSVARRAQHVVPWYVQAGGDVDDGGAQCHELFFTGTDQQMNFGHC